MFYGTSILYVKSLKTTRQTDRWGPGSNKCKEKIKMDKAQHVVDELYYFKYEGRRMLLNVSFKQRPKVLKNNNNKQGLRVPGERMSRAITGVNYDRLCGHNSQELDQGS